MLVEHVDVQNAERPALGLHRRGHVHAAGPADEEVGDPEREAVALEVLGLADFDDEPTPRTRGRNATVPAAEGALARAKRVSDQDRALLHHEAYVVELDERAHAPDAVVDGLRVRAKVAANVAPQPSPIPAQAGLEERTARSRITG